MKNLIYISPSTDPYLNLATEKYLLDNVRQDEIILYLWRNEDCVVIGRNQNIHAEVNVEEAQKQGIRLARRLSGGGAVFHDKGNLNFTFISRKSDSDTVRETEVILNAVCSLGVQCEKNGRNDLCILPENCSHSEKGGLKFSGHSYYMERDRVFHNGTVLVSCDRSRMKDVLTASPIKLASKGVDSVRSRTVNLNELVPVTVDTVMKAIVDSFTKEYGDVEDYSFLENGDQSIDSMEKIRCIKERFADAGWIFNRTISSSETYSERFDWGCVDVQMKISRGKIIDCEVFTDALDQNASESLKKSIIGTVPAEIHEKMLTFVSRYNTTKKYEERVQQSEISPDSKRAH